MSYGELLLKSLKKYLCVSIGVIIGSLLYLRFISNFTTTKDYYIAIMGGVGSCLILTGISWVFSIFKFHKNRKL